MDLNQKERPLTIAEKKAIKKRREGTTFVFIFFCIFAYVMYDKMKLNMKKAMGDQAVTNSKLENIAAQAAASRAQAQLFNSGVSAIT